MSVQQLYQRVTMTSTHIANDVVYATDGWHLFGTECPKEKIELFCQVIILCTVILVSIYNLGHGDSTLWTVLLSSSLGYLSPNPSLKSVLPRSTQ